MTVQPFKKLRTFKIRKDGTRYDFPKRGKKPFGVCVHTTGRGVPQRAKRLGQTPDQAGVWVYSQTWQNPPNYLIGSHGMVYRVTDDSLCPPHCGVDAWQRKAMLNGTWFDHVSADGLRLWRERWPKVVSPAHLYPSTSANKDYLGIEMIPLLERRAEWGGLFTDGQYQSLSMLLSSISVKYGIELKGARLVGHEDLDPFDRWDGSGGWDPGWLRARPYFEWSRVQL